MIPILKAVLEVAGLILAAAVVVGLFLLLMRYGPTLARADGPLRLTDPIKHCERHQYQH